MPYLIIKKTNKIFLGKSEKALKTFVVYYPIISQFIENYVINLIKMI